MNVNTSRNSSFAPRNHSLETSSREPDPIGMSEGAEASAARTAYDHIAEHAPRLARLMPPPTACVTRLATDRPIRLQAAPGSERFRELNRQLGYCIDDAPGMALFAEASRYMMAHAPHDPRTPDFVYRAILAWMFPYGSMVSLQCFETCDNVQRAWEKRQTELTLDLQGSLPLPPFFDAFNDIDQLVVRGCHAGANLGVLAGGLLSLQHLHLYGAVNFSDVACIHAARPNLTLFVQAYHNPSQPTSAPHGPPRGFYPDLEIRRLAAEDSRIAS
jgi:hypothetical protein